MITASFAHRETVHVHRIVIMYFVCKTCGEPLPFERTQLGQCLKCYSAQDHNVKSVWFPYESKEK